MLRSGAAADATRFFGDISQVNVLTNDALIQQALAVSMVGGSVDVVAGTASGSWWTRAWLSLSTAEAASGLIR